MDWSLQNAPSLADFEALAEAAFARLPDHFRARCDGLAIRVEDFPDDEVLDDLGLDSPFDLLGLYQGTSLAEKSVLDVPQTPDMVFLYRRPLLDYSAEHAETLGHLVAHVLVHEIGHHFGFSDADMDAIEREADYAPLSG